MWQTDKINIQKIASSTKVRGATKIVWEDDGGDISVDVQYISRDFVLKNYGISEYGEYKQVFDLTLDTRWKKGNQVKYNNELYWVVYVDSNRAKMGASNHVYILISKVI